MQQIHIYLFLTLKLFYFILFYLFKKEYECIVLSTKTFVYRTTSLPLHMLLPKNHNCMLKKHYDNLAFTFSQLSTITKLQNYKISSFHVTIFKKFMTLKENLISAKSIWVQ
jgi:hypothetical protein